MTRRLRIALVAPTWLSLPPRTYGGVEVIVALLARRYVDRGHEVVLFASGDSEADCEVRSIMPLGLIDHMARGDATFYEHYANALAAEVADASPGFDLIHSHLDLAQLPVLALAACPVVQTVHTRLSVDDCWVAARYRDVTVVTLTRFQAASLPRPVPVVPAGLDLAQFPASRQSQGHLAFLSRMSTDKNPAGAIEIAAASGRRLVLAGAPQNSDEKLYFREQIEPHIDGDRVRYIGPVDHAEKTRLLRNAAALLFPIAADEAFGLVMVEAMACGTPVLATCRGSVSEVVDAGVTGYHADDIGSLSELVEPTIMLDREAVRRRAEDRFSYTVMGDAYLSIFEDLVG